MATRTPAQVRKPSLNTQDALAFASESTGAGPAIGGQGQASKSASKSNSGQIPEGDVRLTANIRRDIHKRLKDAASQRQYETGKGFTIGELIEELVEQHLGK